jgi:hypothetical protein
MTAVTPFGDSVLAEINGISATSADDLKYGVRFARFIATTFVEPEKRRAVIAAFGRLRFRISKAGVLGARDSFDAINDSMQKIAEQATSPAPSGSPSEIEEIPPFLPTH